MTLNSQVENGLENGLLLCCSQQGLLEQQTGAEDLQNFKARLQAPRLYTLQLIRVSTTQGHGKQRPYLPHLYKLFCFRGKLKLMPNVEKPRTPVNSFLVTHYHLIVTVTSHIGLKTKELPSYNY